MQGFMIILFILQSFAFYVFARFINKKKRFNTDGTWYFCSKFST